MADRISLAGRSPVRIKPASRDAEVRATSNIGRQIIADHYSRVFARTIQRFKYAVENLGAGFRRTNLGRDGNSVEVVIQTCLLYTSPSPRDS